MTIVELITKKQNNELLTEQDFDFFVKGILSKEIKDYQSSSFLMLIWDRGLSEQETFYLTKAMTVNGLIMDYGDISSPIIDKHSTGGIGDKVSIILVPLLASCNIKFAKMSGRGLGYTGGTIDKLESVNIETELTPNEYLDILRKEGMFIISQSEDIAPSDKILYSLRDTSGTVNNISLIASSIMSKKLATNTDRIYLDVKVGSGAFFSTIEQAREFSKLCISIGKQFNKKVIIHLTNMDKPLGRTVGNLIEIKEALDFLRGNFYSNELKELIYEFATDILIDNNIANSKEDATKILDDKIHSGQAYEKFKRWAKLQKSNYDFDNINNLYSPNYSYQLKAQQDGYIDFGPNKNFGYAVIELKAGRKTKEDKLDFLSGLYFNKTYGGFANKNDTLITIYSSNAIDQSVIDDLHRNIIYCDKPLPKSKNILGIMDEKSLGDNNGYLKSIFEKLNQLKNNSYCDYSKFYVSAIAKCDGKLYYGVNIENAAFPSGVCAEISAITTAISYGANKVDELYILTKSQNFGSPCGNCRQFMSEFMEDDNTKIYLFNPKGEHKVYSIIELLPHRFTKKEL